MDNMARSVEQLERLAGQGQRLKDLRDRKHVSQETAAHEIGVSTRRYRDWENGLGGINDETNLPAVAKYFETTADYIKFGEERSTPDLIGQLGAPDVLTRLQRIEDAVVQLRERLEQMNVERADQIHSITENAAVAAVLEAIASAATEMQAAPTAPAQRAGKRRPRAA